VTALTETRPSIRITGELDEQLSRWFWLLKMFAAIPHYVVLVVLWACVVVVTVIAGIAILITGRYPRALFDFTVGVLRWNWRVGFYVYAALGTDRYPPFTLAAAADYPATLEVAYPGRLSRGRVLVRWLLALPHLVVVALLIAPIMLYPIPALNEFDGRVLGGYSVLNLLVVLAGFFLLVAGRHPVPLFNFLMGINRWSYRVLAYVALISDDYPPFRLDNGAGENRAIEQGRTRTNGSIMTLTSPRQRQARGLWLIPTGLILLTLIPIVSGSFRVTELIGGPELIPEADRFTSFPLPVILHIVSAVIFSIVGAFQFLPGLRRGKRSWHRMAGRVLIPAGLVVALSGLWMAFFSALPPGDGPLLQALRLVFGTYMVVTIVLSVRALIRRKYAAHGAWMTRAYAIGIAAGTQAIFLIPGSIIYGSDHELSRAIAIGAAWVVNLGVAELVIRRRAAALTPRVSDRAR
jgi:hypothetical protein